MKQTMKKRITALLLVFSLAALLSLSAFAEDASTTADPSVGAEASDTAGSGADSAGTTASGAVTITGEVYYGTDYVQFDIHGGSATNLFYDVLYGGAPVYQHVHYTTPDNSEVNSVGIDLEDLGEGYSDVTQYSIQVYRGRAVSATNKPIAQASMAGIYARLNGDPQQDVLIGSVVNGTDVEGIEPPPTYYDQVTDTDYNLVSESMQYDGTKYYAEYEPYVPTPLDGSITYVDNQGNILRTDTISPKIKPENTGADAIVVELEDCLEIQNGTETLNYYPVLETVTADYYGQIDFVVLCNAYASTEGETGLVKIHFMSNGKKVWGDEVNLTTTTFLYTVPESFVQIESGKATQYKLKDDGNQLNEYHQLVLVPGRAENDYYFEYEATAADEVISWNLILMDGTTNTRLGAETMDVEPGETVEFDAAAHAPAGYVPSQETYTYTYGGENLVQYVYYTPDGYVPTESYTVTLQFVNIADGAVLQSESVMVNPGADTEITCPAEFTAGDNTYVRLGGQSDTYRHSYYSPKRTYTIYYRDVNDTLYANTIITNIETVTTERTETGVTYVEDVTTVTGGTVTGPAYATGPAAGTGITDDTTGMNQAVNEEGQGLAQEREEQIAEGETPLAQSPGGETTPEESITDNDTAKSGLSTALMTGGTVAALVVAIVLVVLIVVQRKRNRSTRR